MIERATALGGSCELTGSPLGGVRVRASLPLAPRAGREGAAHAGR